MFEHTCAHCGLPFESEYEIDNMCFDCTEEMEAEFEQSLED